MRFIETTFADWLMEPEPIRDERGYFARTFCARTFAERGLETEFVRARGLCAACTIKPRRTPR